MIGWMLYCIVIAAVVAGAARAAESLARVAGYRMRGIWLGALVLTAFLSVSSGVQRLGQYASLTPLATPHEQAAPPTPTAATWIQLLRSIADRVEQALDSSLAFAATSIDRTASSSAMTYTGLAWLAVSFAFATLFAAVIYRFQRARRQWPLSRVEGVPVRVSPSVGPIVIGFVRPEIVVPRWLLHRAVDEQRLAVAHEQEHLRARDPMALGFAWLVVILAPWNAALWYMLSRLRLTIELDCDARVLRRGAVPRAYGSLLIDVAQNASPLTLSALGFADESSQLYQRILALREPVVSFARTRAVVAALVAAAGVLVACRIAPPPRSALVLQKATRIRDVAGESPVAAPKQLAQRSSVQTARSQTRQAPRRPSLRRIKGAPEATGHLDSVWKDNSPLVLIDGVRSSLDDMHRIDPKTIANVDVIKGAAVIASYGVDAEHGVINITTKQPPR